jgi:microcystin-dependent protein
MLVILCLVGLLVILYLKYVQIENFSDNDDLTVSDLHVSGAMNIFPSGIVVAWNGDVPPVGWAICNGKNGTPDLTNKFILGVGGSYALNATGGSATTSLTVNDIPNHGHAIGFSSIYTAMALVQQDGLGKTYLNGMTDNKKESFLEKTGGNASHNNMHPYYVLAFIMKL